METSDLQRHPPFRILTFRDGQEVIAEDVETEVAARTRFASAVDLCKASERAHTYRVELRAGSDIVDTWPPTADA